LGGRHGKKSVCAKKADKWRPSGVGTVKKNCCTEVTTREKGPAKGKKNEKSKPFAGKRVGGRDFGGARNQEGDLSGKKGKKKGKVIDRRREAKQEPGQSLVRNPHPRKGKNTPGSAR